MSKQRQETYTGAVQQFQISATSQFMHASGIEVALPYLHLQRERRLVEDTKWQA